MLLHQYGCLKILLDNMHKKKIFLCTLLPTTVVFFFLIRSRADIQEETWLKEKYLLFFFNFVFCFNCLLIIITNT